MFVRKSFQEELDQLRLQVELMGIKERVGDLALRVVKLLPDRHLWASSPATFDLLVSMCDTAVEAFRDALRAWSAQDLTLASELTQQVRVIDARATRLSSDLLALQGPDAVRIATCTILAGRSLDRIADHAAIIGARLRYLLTGDPEHLTAEVR